MTFQNSWVNAGRGKGVGSHSPQIALWWNVGGALIVVSSLTPTAMETGQSLITLDWLFAFITGSCVVSFDPKVIKLSRLARRFNVSVDAIRRYPTDASLVSSVLAKCAT